jgi:glycosyltransferase involved in cell wall biosynthesis
MLDTLQAETARSVPLAARDRPADAAARGGVIWITWEHHRRTRELSHDLGIELIEILAEGPALVRYPVLLLQTMFWLARRRPMVLFIQCPSVILAVWALMLKAVGRFQVIADLHNEAVEPFIYGFRGYRRLLRWIQRRADLNIVTNRALANTVRASGGRVFVLADRIPALHAPARTSRTTGALAVFICTYAPDEPYRDVIEAARLLGPNVSVSITGDPRRAALPELPPNVTITGHLSESDYVALLNDADALIDLTDMENCLVCGAYEAVALEKPLVTSDTAALRTYFRRGAVFARHDPRSLADAIALALRDKLRLERDMQRLKRELSADWVSRRNDLARLVLKGEVR